MVLLFRQVKNNRTQALQYLICAPYTEQLQVNLTLMLPSYTISPNHPPVAIKSSARFFSNDSFLPDNKFRTTTGYSWIWQSFFRALIYSKDGIPSDDLLANSTRLIEAVEHQYRVYAAQAYNITY
jgi:hypothetical protein